MDLPQLAVYTELADAGVVANTLDTPTESMLSSLPEAKKMTSNANGF